MNLSIKSDIRNKAVVLYSERLTKQCVSSYGPNPVRENNVCVCTGQCLDRNACSSDTAPLYVGLLVHSVQWDKRDKDNDIEE